MFFKKISALNNDQNILNTLNRAAREVTPLMERRGWIVDLLTEFFPSDHKLQGLNIKEGDTITIKIRCRYSQNKKCSYQSIFYTLLHELAHIQCGPHDQKFYDLLNSLKRESVGHVLSSHHVICDRDELRLKMADAAEKRLLSEIPQILGGSESHLSLKERIALAAIKRASLN